MVHTKTTGFSHPGFEGQRNLGQEKDEALQADGDIFEDEVGDSHGPDQVEEVKAAEVGLGKYEAERRSNTHVN